ncbi:hypothetical protein [Comamonas kerstersii]
MLGQSGACMDDDMGLGKSRQTVVACRLAAGKQRVLIVCPASLRLNWEREIKMVYPDAVVGMLGDDRMATLHGCDWVIGNYERMGGLVREVDLQFQIQGVHRHHDGRWSGYHADRGEHRCLRVHALDASADAPSGGSCLPPGPKA